ncbi:MAG: YhcN/YlaJ family sporulation lipoprotein [Tissierellia bacterium]|nr:YhcN/YlaJ family sporulation lipoprotein [Tissierellia bacterium]
MKKNKILFLVVALTLVLVTIGCTARPQRSATRDRVGWDTTNQLGRRNTTMLGIERRNKDIRGIDRRNMDNITGMDGIGPNTATDLTRRNTRMTREERIAERIANLKEINNASVLISGNTAIVGVDMDRNLQGNMTTALKQKIERIVRNADDRITNVSITADPDLFTRISNMAKDIRDGRPVTGFAREFQEILRRISPAR